MALLFTPLTIKSITLPNRIAMSPMCQYSAEDGFVTDWHFIHQASRAVGGVGLIITEATAVCPEGRITPYDLGIWKDDHIEGYKKLVNLVHSHNAKAGIQIAHAGRKASCAKPWEGGHQLLPEKGGWQAVAPSALPYNETEVKPLALDSARIEKVIADFRNAAARAAKAGFDVLEIHSAHGYLLHEFLSPLSNKRTDNYGGSFENRSRLLLEIVDAVKTVWPSNLPLFVRISATDWMEDGWNVDEAIRLADLLKAKGVDLIDTSSGGLSPHQKIQLGPGYQVPFAERIRKETGIRTGSVGLITTAHQAEDILKQNKADLILLGRELLRNPYFALHAAKELGAEIPWPLQYARAKG